jgi:hypothetical protein
MRIQQNDGRKEQWRREKGEGGDEEWVDVKLHKPVQG